MPGTRLQYPPEFKAEAVQLVQSSGRAISQIAKDLDLWQFSRRTWVKQAETHRGKRERLPAQEPEELNAHSEKFVICR